MITDKPLVSICCITYNHEKYIAQALDSILMQKFNSDYEIVVGEDCSTDNTRKILLEYADRFPDKFKLLLHEKNVGLMQNFVMTMCACAGKYIALCECDDYWTDPYKLQKQVDFLEINLDFSGSAHQSLVQYENKQRVQHLFYKNVKPILQLNNFLAGMVFHTASLVYRAKIIHDNELPPNIISGDRALILLCATYGPIKYFNEPMCVYRKSAGGISSWITYDMLIKDLAIIPWIKSIYPSFPKYKYLAFIHKTIVTYPKKVPSLVKIKHWSLFVFYSFSYFPFNMLEILKIIIKMVFCSKC